MSTEVQVAQRPSCDLCKSEGSARPAYYDGATVMGPWAYMCEEHMETHGVGLGTGRGQRLMVKGDPNPRFALPE